MLNFCGSLIHGTRGFGNQIGQHLGAENYLNFEGEQEISKISNLQLKTMCQKLRNSKNTGNRLLGSTINSSIKNTVDYTALTSCSLSLDSTVAFSSRALFDNTGII